MTENLPKTKHRLNKDFDIASGYNLHQDAIAALGRLEERLVDVPRYKLVSFAIMTLEKVVEEQIIEPTDDLEARLDLLTY